MPSPKRKPKTYVGGLDGADRWTLKFGYVSSRTGGDPAGLPRTERDRLRALWDQYKEEIVHPRGYIPWGARHFDGIPGPVHPYEHLGED